MHVVDTNVLVYAASGEGPEHAVCLPLVDGWRAGAEPWFSTWGIVYEFLRVVTHPVTFHRPRSALEGWSFIEALFAAPRFGVLEPTAAHREVAARSLREVPSLRGSPFHDFHTAVLMREHGIRTIYTRDTDFHRFPWLDVIDPLA